MRSDYAYVNKACGICLTTTKLGNKHAASVLDSVLEDLPDGSINCLVTLIEDAYIVLPDEASVTDWVDAINVQSKNYGEITQYEIATVLAAFALGFIAVEKVIWDD